MPGAPTPSPAPTILVVDDDSSMVALCKMYLEQDGFSVLTADGSREALKLCSQHHGPINLLLTDLFLPPPDFEMATGKNEFPHVNGHILAGKAAEIRKGLRIVLMSAVSKDELAKHAIRHGSLPFIHKPIKKTSLVEVLHATLQQPPPTVTVKHDKDQGEVPWFD